MYLFSWDNVPGKENGKLIEYLEQKYGVDWVRTAKIEKIDNNEIKVANEKNFLSLRLNNENTKVTLTINKVKTDEFIVKTENSKLNIYTDIEQEKKDIRQGVKVKEISYPYSVLGGLVLAGLIIVALMGYYGTQSAGIFSPREAFFVIGASILILSAASVYQFMTLRDTISVLKIHEEELQSARDTAQEMRLASLESTRSGATTSLAPRVAALEPQLATLEKRVTALEVKRP
ncbi:MAG TPA: hypothetical protein VKL21_01335 [Candidatus Methanoperedens sp.]|nr:hypothetical protein [Candidatus Methanoperedens sp.]